MRDEDILVLEICKNNSDNSIISALINNESIDWSYFLEVISKHKIAPFVLDILLKFPLPERSKKLLANRGEEEIVKNMLRRNILKNELRRVYDTLRKNGIECILMKGLSLDFNHLRVIGDLDILIKKEELIKAIGVLHDIDYIFVGHFINLLLNDKEKKDIHLQLSWNNQYQLYNQRTGLLLELHTNLFERTRAYTLDLNTLFDNIELFRTGKRYDDGLNCFIFCPEHLLFLMCLHNAIKRPPSNNTFILRTIIDIDSLIKRGIHWDVVVETSIKMNTAPFVYFSLLLTQRLIDSSIPLDVLTALKNACSGWQLALTNTHLKCVISLRANSIFYSNIYRILSPFVFGKGWKDRIKWLLLVPILFPPRWKMAGAFNIKTKSPLVYFTYLLNPFRWLYLIMKNLFR